MATAAGLVVAGVLVREGLCRGRSSAPRGLRLAEVVPDLGAGDDAELRRAALEHLGVLDLAAAALAEDAADQRGGGDHVGRLPVLERLPHSGVLGRHLERVEPGLARCTVLTPAT